MVSEPNWLQKGQKRIWISDAEDDTGRLTVVNANFTSEEHLAGSRASANTELASYSPIVSQVTHKTVNEVGSKLREPAIMSCTLLGWVFCVICMRWNISHAGQNSRGLCTRCPKPVCVVLLLSLCRIGSWRYSEGNCGHTLYTIYHVSLKKQRSSSGTCYNGVNRDSQIQGAQ